MRQILIFASLLLCSTIASHLSIIQPNQLKDEFYDKKNKIENNLASFGYIPYGSYLLGRAYFQADNQIGCSEFSSDYDTRGDPDGIFTPIFVAKRGGCTFVQKARRAQNAGAKLLIVIDTVYEGVNSILMSDDGTGGDISIPSILIDIFSGERILKYLQKNQTLEENWVTMRAVFDTWQSEKVEYDIYFMSSQLYFYLFLHDMQGFHSRLGITELRPHFMVHLDEKSEIIKESKDCYGKYCIFSDNKANGKQVLKEQLRQICILNRNKPFDSEERRVYDTEAWFKYVAEFYNFRCDNSDENCSFKAMWEAGGLDPDKTEDCISNAFRKDSLTDEVTIAYFDYEIEEWNRTWNTIMYPAITINRTYYKGNFIPEEVFKMICASYLEAPQGCKDNFNPPDEPQPEPQSTGLSAGAIIGIVILILIINVIVILCYRRYSKRDEQNRLKTEVNSAVSAYFALNEQERT